MQKLMILGASLLQLPAIIKAKEMGLQVIVVDMDPNAVGFKVEGVICEVISTIDQEAVLESAKRHKIDGIVTICTDLPMRTVARVAREMGLPGITEESAFMCTNKAAMRKRLKERGVPVPEYYNVFTKEEYYNVVKKFTEKCVVKAVDNSGSRGIQLIDDVHNLKRVEEAFNYCKQYSHSGELVVEEFMVGPEICVETLNFGRNCYPIQITDQLEKKPPYFTDAGYNQPSLLPEETKTKIREIAIAANLALENYTGASCTEMIVTSEGPKVVEVGARLAGDCMTTHLVPMSTGVDMVEGVINIALGLPVDITAKYHKGSAIRYYLEPVIGEIVAVEGTEEAKQVDGIQQVTIVHGVGEIARPLRNSADRLAFVIAQADNSETAIKQCDIALAKLKFITKKNGEGNEGNA